LYHTLLKAESRSWLRHILVSYSPMRREALSAGFNFACGSDPPKGQRLSVEVSYTCRSL
jgi:hypothetical protein